MNDFNILYDNQYGFRRNHSTSLALVDLYDKISLALDRKEIAAGVFIDLSKAFDTVNHNILFDKLQHYEVRGLALDWVKSYFHQRSQFVEYNGHRSLPQVIRCGVPQGSILGPLFFIIYVNDLCDASRLESILFADDTNLFISEKDPVTLNNTLNSELNKLSAWFAANKLSLNISKTKFMVFRPRQKRLCYDYDISINGEALTQVSEALFLGVLLDDCLSWKSHISLVAHKISKSIGIIYRSSYFLSKTSLRTLYNSLVLPYLYYCNLVWGSTYKRNLKRLTILQKRAIRIASRSGCDAHTDPIFKELRFLKMKGIHLFQLGQFMYSFSTGNLSTNFDSFFSVNNSIHSYNTRHASFYRLPLCRTNIRQFSISFQGPKFFNTLSSEIKNSLSLMSFKYKLKDFLINNY